MCDLTESELEDKFERSYQDGVSDGENGILETLEQALKVEIATGMDQVLMKVELTLTPDQRLFSWLWKTKRADNRLMQSIQDPLHQFRTREYPDFA
jgi:hypothetical protein